MTEADSDFTRHLNPQSLEVVTARCEMSLRDARKELRYQFERLGYFALDKDSTADHAQGFLGKRGEESVIRSVPIL